MTIRRIDPQPNPSPQPRWEIDRNYTNEAAVAPTEGGHYIDLYLDGRTLGSKSTLQPHEQAAEAPLGPTARRLHPALARQIGQALVAAAVHCGEESKR